MEVHSDQLSTFQHSNNIKMIKYNRETLWSTNYFIIIMENLFLHAVSLTFHHYPFPLVLLSHFHPLLSVARFFLLLFHEFYFIFMRLIATYPHHTLQPCLLILFLSLCMCLFVSCSLP